MGVSDAALVDFCTRHQVAELSIFGSILRDDFRPDSDVDILFELRPDQRMSIEKYLLLHDDLMSLFNARRIHLVEKPFLRNPVRRESILASRRVLYAA